MIHEQSTYFRSEICFLIVSSMSPVVCFKEDRKRYLAKGLRPHLYIFSMTGNYWPMQNLGS
jgi:hypothetical protein